MAERLAADDGPRLIAPDAAYEGSYRAYIAELGDEERYPFPMDFDCTDFTALLARLDDFACGRDIPRGLVPSTTYWLVEDGELMGVSNLRHYLSDRIRERGGHIGLGIRPSYRGRGLGRRLMALTIDAARARGMGALHIHCLKHNLASARMIVANGGVLQSEVADADASAIVQRYVVA